MTDRYQSLFTSVHFSQFNFQDDLLHVKEHYVTVFDIKSDWGQFPSPPLPDRKMSQFLIELGSQNAVNCC